MMKLLRALGLIRKENNSSEHSVLRQKIKSESSSLVRTPTQLIGMRRGLLSLSPKTYQSVSGLLHSNVSFPNTVLTSDTVVHVMVTSNDGVRKECFFGTQSQVAEKVHHFLTTGEVTSGMVLLPRSCSGSVAKVSSSRSSALLPDASSIWLTDRI